MIIMASSEQHWIDDVFYEDYVPPKMQEHVLCVSSKVVDRLVKENYGVNEALKVIEKPQNLAILPRYLCEEDESWRQIIPYIVLYNLQPKRVFVYTRSEEGDRELAFKSSVGIGGHINLLDISRADVSVDLTGSILKNVQRELNEELRMIQTPQHISYQNKIGLIIEDEGIDKFHLGVVLTLQGNGYEEPRSSEIKGGGYVEVGKINPDDLESWSKIVLELVQAMEE